MDYSVADPEFAKSLAHLLGPPLVEGNDVLVLLDGDQIFPAMIEAIRGAQRTITLEQYIWSPGKVSSQFVEALLERARAGVKIHIIVDGIGSMMLGKSDLEPLLQAGAQFVRFNPPRGFRLFKVNHRTHRKLMVVDGKIGFIGGVCISDEWLGNADAPNRWREIHFRVSGPVVAQMQAVFMDNWLETRSELLDGTEYFAAPQPGGSISAQIFKSGPTDGAENARLSYLVSIAAARQNIRLAHAYFVPSDAAIETLLASRQRGVRIEIIVPARTDAKIIGQASRSRWGKLLEAGVEFYEYQPALYHPKMMIVDDAWVTVGSVNFDERSFVMNDEANLNVADRSLASELITIFEEDKKRSRRLTATDLKRRPWLVRCWEGFLGLFHSQL
ncbi:MAG: cardiolipin synthase [Verrucomicrobia subdivision 3 bacterium]|nr:cardiolipin synthase [Limisphaerales bacterium]